MNRIERVQLSASAEWEKNLVEQHIRQKYEASDGASLNILEAGCGQRWPLNLEGVPYMLTGVDLDKAALEIRKNVMNDLHEIIEADLRTVALDDARFDVIYNAYVLEHIDGAEFVLKRFVDWLKPGGLLILHIPDPNSVQGFVTRISPHWFHVFYYRFILGKTSAGKPGYAPYRTYYDHVVSRSGIRKFCQENKLAIISEVGNAYWKPGRGILKPAIVLFKKFVSIMSFGVLAWQYTDLLYIIRKKGDSRAD